MAGFIKKKIQSFTLGEKLKKIREKRGVSLAEISNFTKVKQDHLQKIEDGDFEKLPPDVYVKGFLKSYAKFFNLDPDEIISYYEKEIGIRNNIKKYQNPIQRKKRELFPNIAITPKVFTALFSALVVIGGFAYFYLEIEKFSKDPRLVILQPSSQSSVDKSSVEIIGLTDEENKVTINGQPIRINNQGEFKENLGLHKGVNKVVIQAKNKFGAATERELNISADFKVASVRGVEDGQDGETKEEKEGGQKKEFSFSIEARDDPVWIAVEVDGEKKQDGTMLPGSVQAFKVKEKIKVTSGKADKTYVKIDGKEPVKLADHPGVERGAVFDKNGKIKENEENENQSEKEKEGDSAD